MDTNKFFAFLDKYRKWIMLVGFVLIVGFLCTGRKFGMVYLSPYNWKFLFMLLKGELNEDLQGATASIKFRVFLSLLNYLLIIAFFVLSAIALIFTFRNKQFFFSIPFAVLILSQYISYNGQLEMALYYRIPLTLAFIACLTLELLSKYRDRLIKKAQPSEPSEDNSKNID